MKARKAINISLIRINPDVTNQRIFTGARPTHGHTTGTLKTRQMENTQHPLNDPEHEPRSLVRSTSSIKSWYDKNDPLVYIHPSCSTPARTTLLLLYCCAAVLKHSGDTHIHFTFNHCVLNTQECPLPYSTMSNEH